MLTKKCLMCGKSFEKPYYCSIKEWENVRKFCSRKCKAEWVSKNLSGKNSKCWKGGTINMQGYKIFCNNGKRISEHRYIMEKYLGRKLLRKEIIHHIDGNRLNNSLDNLFLFSSSSEHMKNHFPSGSKFGKNQTKVL
jgi:hypothetical protein